MNYFNELNKVDCSDKVEKKNGLTYLSWAFAWGELKKRYPNSYYTIYESNMGWNYFSDSNTCWVKTGVTVVYQDDLGVEHSIEHIEYLPIMDYRNKSIPQEAVTSFDVNKTIQRSLTKAVARHGLGLYIYAGEDIPSESDGDVQSKVSEAKAVKQIKTAMSVGQVEEVTKPQKEALINLCNELEVNVEELLKDVGWEKGKTLTKEMYGVAMNTLIQKKKGK